MPRSPHLLRQRPIGLAAAIAAVALALTGCAADAPEPTGSATPTAGTEAPAPGGSDSPAPTPTEEPATPFEVACDVLLTPDQVYAFNPNYSAAPGYAPAAAGVVGVTDEAGTACGLVNQTNGALIEYAVATPPEAALEARKNDAALGSNPVPTYGTPPDVEGYFERSGETGEAQVFTGEYWIVVASTELVEPGDAQSLVSAIVANLEAA
ncbi:iron ABC transporter ATP-binding protein [Agromyces endophyticus]|uniref:iron ABC transporter ATP-binding protein n=1 Tax=Agromyces sp. H17E-10 TaxID=2932244 RepID=UPI001FD38219|nr:iron ABC transporter ATP-binding protein [Agromyces sp. H17E-10]UOQ89730.1 iron ABC transporter ATP-binding protein [Agromyces sp. H17E-10]